MSYFTVVENNQQVINKEDVNVSNVERQRKRDHKGINNPHYGHKLNVQQKENISTAMKERNQGIKENIEQIKQRQLDEEKAKEVFRQVLREYMSDAAILTNNKQS